MPGAVHTPTCSVLTGAERGLLLCWSGCWPGLLVTFHGWGSHAGFLTPSQFCREGGRSAFLAGSPGSCGLCLTALQLSRAVQGPGHSLSTSCVLRG